MTATADPRDAFDAAMLPGMRDRLAEIYRRYRAREEAVSQSLAPGGSSSAPDAYRTRDCPSCGYKSAALQPVLEARGLALLDCPECGLTYTRQVMVKAADSARYKESDLDAEGIRLRCSEPYVELESARARYYLRTLESARAVASPSLLEIGCGTGTLLLEGQLMGWHCVGLEPSIAAQVARSRGATGAIDGYFPNDLPPEPARYDAIAMLDVLEHFAEPLDILGQIRPLLTPSTGRLFVQVPNWDNPLIRLDGAASPIVAPGHWSYFTPASLPMLLARAGFRAVHIETVVSERDRLGAYPLADIQRCIASLRPGVALPQDLPTAAWLYDRGLGYKLIGTFAPIEG